MPKFRIVIAGGREFTDFNYMVQALDHVLSAKKLTHEIVIVSGKARGADQMGERYAKLRGYAIDDHPANWDLWGKSAGYRRNEEMARNSEATVAFWDGVSKGTKHMIDLTEKVGNICKVFNYESS